MGRSLRSQTITSMGLTPVHQELSMSEANTFRAYPAPQRSGMRLLIAAIVMAVLSAFALSSWAQPHHGGRGMGGVMGSPVHMGRMIDRMLDGVNATDEQRGQIKQIAQAATADLKAQREAGSALRERSMQLFTQPNVDANAVEALRQQMVAQHDQISRRVTQALLDASRVLTPEQRSKLAENMKQRREMMQRHRQERGQLDAPKR
jgi:protein CpxP